MNMRCFCETSAKDGIPYDRERPYERSHDFVTVSGKKVGLGSIPNDRSYEHERPYERLSFGLFS